MGAEAYPIPSIYLHLVAVMDCMSLKQADRARVHLLSAWDLARPDDLIEGFGEHHGLLGGMLEAVIKPAWPEDFKRIIDITYRFSAGWRKVHNPDTGHDVADNLTTTDVAAPCCGPGLDQSGDCRPHAHLPQYRQALHFDRLGEAPHPPPEGSETVHVAVNNTIIVSKCPRMFSAGITRFPPETGDVRIIVL